MNKISAALLVVSMTMSAGCMKNAIQDDLSEKEYEPAGSNETRRMVNEISAFNKNAPDSYMLSFTIDVVSKNKKYKSLGKATYSKNPRMMDIVFTDFIFRSPITMLFQDRDDIRVYFPAEKKLFIDTIKNFDLSNYTEAKINFYIIYGIITGIIPLIEKYRIREGLVSTKDKRSLLILENKDFYQTISFKENLPDKILAIDRKSKQRCEFYLKKPAQIGSGSFYKEIRIISDNGRTRLDINITTVKINIPVRVKTIKEIKLPHDLKVIHM